MDQGQTNNLHNFQDWTTTDHPLEWLYLGHNANRTQAHKCDLSLAFFLRRMLVDCKIAFLQSTGILRFFVGLHTFYCAELGDLEIISWGY